MTNSISLAAFMNGYYCKCYDISTSQDSSSARTIPTVRNGTYSLRIQFSAASLDEIGIICFSEYPSTMLINKHGKLINNAQ